MKPPKVFWNLINCPSYFALLEAYKASQHAYKTLSGTGPEKPRIERALLEAVATHAGQLVALVEAARQTAEKGTAEKGSPLQAILDDILKKTKGEKQEPADSPPNPNPLGEILASLFGPPRKRTPEEEQQAADAAVAKMRRTFTSRPISAEQFEAYEAEEDCGRPECKVCSAVTAELARIKKTWKPDVLWVDPDNPAPGKADVVDAAVKADQAQRERDTTPETPGPGSSAYGMPEG